MIIQLAELHGNIPVYMPATVKEKGVDIDLIASVLHQNSAGLHQCWGL